MQPAKRNLKQLLCYEDTSFGYFSLSNYESLTCPIDKVVQSN